MSRLRVRSASGNWIDICQSDWFLRSLDNKSWIKLDVKKEMKVRHGANSYWLDIDCNVGDVDGLFCPTDDVIGCWPGLTGNFDPTLVGPGGPTGVMICDCSNRNCVSYDGDGPGAVFDGAVLKQPGFRNSHQNEKETAGYLGARKAPVTVYGGRAQVTEFYVDVGFLTGHVFAEWRGFGVRPRVRIYKNCKIVADNFMQGTVWKGNEGQMVVFSDLTTEETDDDYVDNPLLLVRVDAPANSNWEVKVSPSNQNTIGHVLDPLPCFGTYDSDMACVFNAQERMHNMAGSGTTHFDYDVGNVPTRFRIFYRNGALLTSTGNETSGYVVGRGSLSFNFTPLEGDYKILVRVDAKEAAAAWTYSLYCAGQKGSRKTPLDCCGGSVPANCDALLAHCPNPVISNGADVTDFWVDFKSAPDGFVILPYTFQGDEPGQIIIYQNEKVIAASSLLRGEGYFDFEHNRARGTVIKVRVVTSCCTKWTLSPKCPVPYPTINAGDIDFDRCAPTEDFFGRMCFPITISHMIHKPVSVDYEVIAPDASMGAECSGKSSVIPARGATDLIKANTKGRAVIQPCETSTQVCVYTCPKTKKVDDRSITLVLNNPKRGKIGKATAQGNMTCSRELDCLKGGAVAVKEHDPNVHVKQGSYNMYVGEFHAKAGFNTEMFAEIDIPADGEYVVSIQADDYAELYIDCDLIVKSEWVPNANMFRAFTRNMFMTRGKRFMRIYLENGGKNPPYSMPHPCYVALAISTVAGKTVYASRAKDWRANVLFEGFTMKCNQFPETCSITPTGAAKVANAYNDVPLGHGAQRICSTHHDPSCAPYNTYYVLERELDFPVSGTYKLEIMGDDDYYFYVDCNRVASGTLFYGTTEHTFNVTAGKRRVTVMYRNEPGCTPSWVKFVLFHPNGSAFYASAPEGWGSIQGSLAALSSIPVVRGNSHTSMGTLEAMGAAPLMTSPKPHYSWITAETQINLPYTGQYTVIVAVDDQMELFIGCRSIIAHGNWRYTNSVTVELSQGQQSLIIRAYNADSGEAHFFAYVIKDKDGKVILTSQPGSHWKARKGDVDRSGLM